MKIRPSHLALPLAVLTLTLSACSDEPEPLDQPDFGAIETEPMDPDPATDQVASFKAADPWKFGQGEAMAENVCSSCHAITLSDTRPHMDAPAFRDLSLTRDLSALAERFESGIITGHPDMPEFQFEPEEVESLIYYIQSLQLPE